MFMIIIKLDEIVNHKFMLNLWITGAIRIGFELVKESLKELLFLEL